MILDRSFYTRSDVVAISRELLNKILFTKVRGKVTGGVIVETEAYSYKERGCHAYQGKMTARNGVMFGEGGHAYVYLCYGIHHMFNVVTNVEGKADAVLIRALEPLEGLDHMKRRMKSKSDVRITSGPGKLARALAIDRSFNGTNLADEKIGIEDRGLHIARREIVSSPRIGIDYAGSDALLPWRFTVKGNPWISK